MKKEFIKPELAVSIFDMENIVTDSTVVPTNKESVTNSLSEIMSGGGTNGGISNLVLDWII